MVQTIYSPAVISDIATLRTFKGSVGFQHINVQYYSIIGDNGGGNFYWDSASTAADNGGTIIAPTGLATGRWKRQFSEFFNVRWFGAKGDNSTNDTTAIANAITLASTVSGTVYFPVGTYLTDKITLTETINDGISFLGEGKYGQFGGVGSKIKLRSSGTSLLSIQGLRYRFQNLTLDGYGFPTSGVVEFIPTASEIEFSHVNIQGAGLTGGSNPSNLVIFTGTNEIDNIVFRRCRIAQDLTNFAPRCPNAFKNFNPNAFNIAVENSLVLSADILFHFQQGSIDVRHTQVFEYSTAAWYIETYGQAHVIDDCYTERNGGTVNQSSVFYQQAFNAAAVTAADTPGCTITNTQINDQADILSVGTQSITIKNVRTGGNIDHSPAADQTLTGTVTTNGTTTVVGTSGLFATEAPSGVFLLISNEVRQVTTVTDGYHLVLTTAMQSSGSGLTAKRTYHFRNIRAEQVSFTTVGKGFTGTGYPFYADVKDCNFYGSIPLSNLNPDTCVNRFNATGLDASITIGIKDGLIYAVPTLNGNRTWAIEKWRASPGHRIFVFLDGTENANTLDLGGLVTLRNQPGYLSRAELVFNANAVWELARVDRKSAVVSVSKIIATNNSQQSITTATLTVVTNWNESVDTASNFIPTTGVFTAPKTGYYQIDVAIEFDAALGANKIANVYVRTNGTNYLQTGSVHSYGTGSIQTQTKVSGLVSMTAGDTLEIIAYQDSGGTIPLTNNINTNYLSIFEIP